MTGHHEAQEQRAAAIYGLRPSRAQICPRAVAGLRCTAYNDDRRPCVCLAYRHLLDHGRIWLDAAGRHVLTGEPYDVDTDELLAFIADMTRLGLSVHLSVRSLWNPGHCLLVRVDRDQAQRSQSHAEPTGGPDAAHH